MGNREFLAVRLVLEERRHWLEGSKLHFVVWTDHKNRLNTRQARWALFFDHFNFTLTYRPLFKNAMPNALSHMHGKEDDTIRSPEPIITPTRLLVCPRFS